MRVLVTGGAGFIGSRYVRGLVTGEYGPPAEVTVLDALTYAGNVANLPGAPRVRLVVGDVADREVVDDVLPGHDAVVHLAAESHVDRSVGSAAEFVRSNVLGTQTLLEAVVRAGRAVRVVHVSTDEVYGSIEQGSWTESDPLLPNSPYAASKAGSDLVVRAFRQTHGVDVSITRCCNNYGPRQHPEKLIPRFVTSLLRGGTVPVYGRGRNVREWLHVDDHCRAVHRVLTDGRAGAVYNVGGGTALPNLELTRRLVGLCGADESRIRFVTDRPGHDGRYALDDTRIRTELGWAPRTRFEDGLAATVRWYRDHPGWWEPAVTTQAGTP